MISHKLCVICYEFHKKHVFLNNINQNLSCFMRWMTSKLFKAWLKVFESYSLNANIVTQKWHIRHKVTLLKSKVLANLEDRLQQGHLALRHWQRLEPWVGIVNFNNQFRLVKIPRLTVTFQAGSQRTVRYNQKEKLCLRWVSTFEAVNRRHKRRNWDPSAKRSPNDQTDCGGYLRSRSFKVISGHTIPDPRMAKHKQMKAMIIQIIWERSRKRFS